MPASVGKGASLATHRTLVLSISCQIRLVVLIDTNRMGLMGLTFKPLPLALQLLPADAALIIFNGYQPPNRHHLAGVGY